LRALPTRVGELGTFRMAVGGGRSALMAPSARIEPDTPVAPAGASLRASNATPGRAAGFRWPVTIAVCDRRRRARCIRSTATRRARGTCRRP